MYNSDVDGKILETWYLYSMIKYTIFPLFVVGVVKSLDIDEQLNLTLGSTKG
jgi:hypothetical protein